MHLRKLAWCLPLLLATTAARAEQPGSFLEGAQLVSLTSAGAQVTANSTPAVVRAGAARPLTSAPTAPMPALASLSAPAAEAPGAAPEVRSLAVLVAALAMVGFIQRRRPDA